MTALDRTLEVAGDVADVVRAHGHTVAVIGAVALAVHGYPRSTEDLELGTLVRTPRELTEVAAALRARGHAVRVALPDAEDPLGGVLTIEAPGAEPVQLVNFFNPWNGWALPGKLALETASPDVLPRLAVVDVPHLVALKLYAGGRKSEVDVLELLERQGPEAVEASRRVCHACELGAAFDALCPPSR